MYCPVMALQQLHFLLVLEALGGYGRATWLNSMKVPLISWVGYEIISGCIQPL